MVQNPFDTAEFQAVTVGKHVKEDPLPTIEEIMHPEDTPVKKKKKTWLWILLSLLIVSSVAVGVYFRPLTVATAVEKAQLNSTEPCKSYDHFASCKVEWKVSDTVKTGRLISQSHEGKAMRTAHIVLVYSKGPQEATMPNIEGMTIEDATLLLNDLGVDIGEVQEVEGEKAGRIVSASVPVDEKIVNGQKINVTVSSGIYKAPNLMGKTKEQVQLEMKDSPLGIKFEEETSDSATPGTVIKQSIEPDTETTEKVLIVTIAQKKEVRHIPLIDVVGKTQDEATALLASEGFSKIGSVTVNMPEEQKNKVVATYPNAGKEASVSDIVVIVVGK